MMHALMIRLRQAEGATLRAIGVAERRGFRVVSLQLEPSGELQTLSMVVHSPDRRVDVLGRQLERLYDVLEVVVAPAAAQLQAPQRPVPVAVGVS